MFLQRFHGAQKTKIFLVTFGSAFLYRATCLWTLNRKSSLFLNCCKERNERNVQFSQSKFHVHQHGGCRFCCTSMEGQTVLKVHCNLNKGASGSMKLNWWHLTTSRQPRKNILKKMFFGVCWKYYIYCYIIKLCYYHIIIFIIVLCFCKSSLTNYCLHD